MPNNQGVNVNFENEALVDQEGTKAKVILVHIISAGIIELDIENW